MTRPKLLLIKFYIITDWKVVCCIGLSIMFYLEPTFVFKTFVAPILLVAGKDHFKTNAWY